MRDLYWNFVRPAADFMMIYRDPLTGLPRPSYDLWEERYGVFLFTCSTVCAALEAAAALATVMGEDASCQEYCEGAAEIRAGVAAHLYDPDLGRFAAMLHVHADGRLERDPVLDSSMAGVFVYGLFPAGDPRVVATMQAISRQLANPPPVGGIARRGRDYYHHVTGNYDHYQGNCWFVSTLWLADWLAETGARDEARRWIEWCPAHALPSGVMAEQLHPDTGEPLSVSPLTWSHAAFVASVERYLRARSAQPVEAGVEPVAGGLSTPDGAAANVELSRSGA
jgi:GH15 family glucan-1,4-alpha-glucosidase